MDLLIFAHRGEAQCFLKEMDLKAHPQNKALYLQEDGELGLLLTGEGHHNVLTNLGLALGLLGRDRVKRLINFGICAALNTDLKKGEIYSIRSIYGQGEFKSFQTQDSAAKLDVITANERLLDNKKAKELEHIAPLADREAWAIGFVAKQVNLELLSYKLISDHVTDAPICEYIKDLAEEYSQTLYEYYLSLNHENKVSSYENPFSNNKNFYFTLSLNREVSNLCKQLCVKYETQKIDQLINLNEILDLEQTPKKKALFLRDLLKEKLYPTRTKIIKQLDQFIENSGLEKKELSYDSSIEKIFLNLKVNLKSEKELKLLATKIRNIDWQEFESIMNGELL